MPRLRPYDNGLTNKRPYLKHMVRIDSMETFWPADSIAQLTVLGIN